MNRSTLPLGLSTLKRYWEDENKILFCDLPFQRHSGVWNAITCSNLIRSILMDSYVPSIVLLKDKVGKDTKGKDTFRYEILDGQQRLTTLFRYMSDEFRLHSATQEVEVDGTIYDVGGLLFSELSEECQDAVKGFRFSIQCLENYTFDEVETLFYNINSGVALSTIQKSKSKLGTEMMVFLNGLLSGSFFTQAINITTAQARSEDDLGLLLQMMLLLDNRHENLEYKNISTSTCLSYAESIRKTYTKEKRMELMSLVQYLDDAFTQRNKFLRKNNVPIVAVCAKVALEQDRDAISFRAFINEFANNIYPTYEEASKSGNIKGFKVQMRLRVMFLAMCKFYGMNADDIKKPFADNIPLFPEANGVTEGVSSSAFEEEAEEEIQNSEVIEGEATFFEVEGDTEQKTVGESEG